MPIRLSTAMTARSTTTSRLGPARARPVARGPRGARRAAEPAGAEPDADLEVTVAVTSALR